MNYLFLCIALVVFAGCDQKQQVRQYKEVVTEAPVNAPFMNGQGGMDTTQDPHAGLDMSSMPVPSADNQPSVAWTVPQGWSEEPAKGLRLATFHDATNPQDIDVSIVPLGGSLAGGLKPNLKRWLGQIKVQVSDEQLESFMQSSTNNIFDFSQLQKGQDPSTKSMMVAILTLPDQTIFIKMAGSIDAINRQKDKFLELVKSVHAKAPEESSTVTQPQDTSSVSDPHAGMDMSSINFPMAGNPSDSQLKWQVPDGWKEQPASGMRIVTFRLSSDLKAIDCYIVTLGGVAGGVEANLSRWMSQIGIKSSSEDIQKVISSSQNVKTQGGMEAKVYDFTVIQNNASPTTKSMIAAIISTQDSTIFVKMTGSVEAINQNRNKFIELVKSLHS